MIGNKRFSDEYIIETVDGDKPKKVATYIGVMYEYGSPKLSEHIRIYMLMLAVFMAASFALSGVTAFGVFNAYALIPYVFQCITVLMFVTITVEILFRGNTLREPERRRTYGRVRMIAVVHIALCVTAVIADAVFFISSPKAAGAVDSALFIAFELLSLATAVYFAAVVGSVKLRTVTNHDAVRIAAQREKDEREKTEREAQRKEQLREQSRAANALHNRKKK